jgi:hypothetical protein
MTAIEAEAIAAEYAALHPSRRNGDAAPDKRRGIMEVA